jgi:uncharacterized protein (DUF58 family)
MRSPKARLERVRITKVGVWFILATVVIGVAAANTGNNALYLVEAVLLGLLVLSGLASKRNLSRLVLDFEEPPEVHCSQVFSVPFTVRNGDRLLARRYLLVGGLADVDSVLVAHLGAAESSRESLTFRIKRRGLHRFEHVRISSVFPFGLFEKAMRYPAGLEILVYPEIFPAGAMRQFDPLRLGEEPSRRIGWSHELRTLRSFRHGDDPRGVHWKRSARMGELIFMEREAEEGLRLTIVLDNAVGRPADEPEAARFERLVSEAASAAVHYLEAGYEVALTTRGEAIPYAGGRIQRQRILTALALLEALPRRSEPLWSGRKAPAELRLGGSPERRAS